MADNIDVTPGTGKTIAADEIASILYQRVKLSIGADGSATDLAFGQAVMASSIPVVIASNQSAITVAPAPAAITFTDRSGTVTTGGTSQSIMSSNSSRKYLLIVNISNTVLWINIGTTAVQDSPSIPLAAASVDGAADGGILEYYDSVIPTGQVNLIGPTTGKKFVAKEA